MTTKTGESAPDPVEWLRAAMDAAQRDAEAGTPGPWAPRTEDPGDDEVYTVHDGEGGDLVGDVVAYVRGQEYLGKTGQTLANMHLIAAHASPTAVLRRITADRRVADRHQPKRDLRHVDSAGKVDWATVCGHDGKAWPCPDVTDLAEAWGWVEEATKADAPDDAVDIRMTDEQAEDLERTLSFLGHTARVLLEAHWEAERQRRPGPYFFWNRPPPNEDCES